MFERCRFGRPCSCLARGSIAGPTGNPVNDTADIDPPDALIRTPVANNCRTYICQLERLQGPSV